MPDYRDAIKKVLQHEGGYVNNPKDLGKRTNYGVTQAVYEQYIGRKLKGSDTDAVKGKPMEEAESVMRSMPIGNAIAIYKQLYWDKVQGDKIRKYAIAAAIFDQAINRGHVAAAKQAQRVLKNVFNYSLVEDGIIGASSIAALNSVDEAKFLNSYLQESILAYNKIVQNNPTQSVFLNGWLKRVESLRSYVSQNIGKINATTVGIGVGVVIAFGVGSYFLYKYLNKSNAVSSKEFKTQERLALQAA
jgi:lysozyme family protein